MRDLMRRRTVLQLGAACAVLPIVGCGAAEPPAPAPPPPSPVAVDPPSPPPVETAVAAPAPSVDPSSAVRDPFTRVVGRVGKNHGHTLTLTVDEVKAASEKTYDLRGKATHAHALTLSAADMKVLLAGEILRTKSTTDKGHTHRLVVRCAPAVDPPEWVGVCNFTLTGQDEHEIIVTQAEMEAKVDKTYEIQGLAGHSHQVTLTSADYQKLAAGGAVNVKSTRDAEDAHLHAMEITLKKARA
jgi:hypothetical protein